MKETEKVAIKIGDKIIAIKDVRITDNLFVHTGEIHELHDIAGSVPILQDEEGTVFAFVEKDISEYFMKAEKNADLKKGDKLKAIKGSTVLTDKLYEVESVFEDMVAIVCEKTMGDIIHIEKYVLTIGVIHKYFVKVSHIAGFETKPEVDHFENECMDCYGCAFYDECFEEIGDGDMVDYILAEANYQIFKPFKGCTIVTCKLPNGYVITESINCTDADEDYDDKLGVEICLNNIEEKVRELEEYRALQNLWEFEGFNQSCDSDCDDCEECCGFCGDEESCEKYE